MQRVVQETTRDIRRAFERAGLRYVEAKAPFASGAAGALIFGMSIEERDTLHERFAIWPGSETQLDVVDADPRVKQVVLHVKEPVRMFRQDWVVLSDEDLEDRLIREPATIIERVGHYVKVERTTPAADRYFLSGQDESHYFITQLPRSVSSVRDAHDALRPELARRPGTLRQGEWFFVPLDPRQTEHLTQFLARAGRDLVRRDAPLDVFGRGAPHIAEELLRNDRHANAVFARGVIRQAPRHKPLDLGREWRMVVRNLEIDLPSAVDWVD